MADRRKVAEVSREVVAGIAKPSLPDASSHMPDDIASLVEKELGHSSDSRRQALIENCGISVLGEGKVKLTLPATMSRAGFLYRVQAAARESYGRDAIFPARLEKWATEAAFTETHPNDVVVAIYGRVKGSVRRSKDEQVQYMKERQLQMPVLRDLAVAHAAYFLAGRADLFCGSVVRASDGSLFFFSDGLDIDNSSDGFRFDNIATCAWLSVRD